jgi:hypothetical protein
VKERLQSISPWAGIFAATFLFQLYRGEQTDSIIFFTATLIISLEPAIRRQIIRVPSITMDRRTLWAIALSGALLMSYVPRGDKFLVFIFLTLAIILFLELWGMKAHRTRPDVLARKSQRIWISLAILICLIELGALISARISGNEAKFATISELVVPVLDTSMNRFGFSLLWLLIGWLVIRHWEQR